MQKSNNEFGRAWNIWFVLFFSIGIKILLSYLFHNISSAFNMESSESDEFNVTEKIIAIIIIAPIIETLIFQFMIQELIFRIVKIGNIKSLFLISISVSSLLFSSTHYNSLFHIGISFISGLIYSTLYVIVKLKFESRLLAFF